MSFDNMIDTFIAEARDLLAGMEDYLIRLEREPGDAEAIAATFRAIHTIKGSAGLFGLEDIVSFSHVVENVLDLARSNAIAVDGSLTGLLLECADHIGILVDVVAGAKPNDTEGLKARADRLLGRLAAHSSPSAPRVQGPLPDPAAPPRVTSGMWHISLRPGRTVLHEGIEPASFIRYLSTLGDVVSVTTLYDALPPAEDMDAEACYLGFEIDLKGNTTKEAIAEVFEFMADNCRIRILPPNSKIEEYLEFIRELPEGRDRIGAILVASGALTAYELKQALQQQRTASSEENKPRLGEILVQNSVVEPRVVKAALDKQARDRRHAEVQLVRVDAGKLEDLINEIGEMVIASASVGQLARRAADADMLEAISVFGRMVERIRDSALGLRMVEIGDTFRRFHRVVRDVSRELGKEITLEISGEDAELDKTVVEKINDPLVHLVRNAIDHGIEAPDVRVARGKPSAGKVSLHAYHESGGIVIEVSDDGGGLNRERILAKAVERGIVQPGQNLSDREVFNLVFEPGFSTADQITNLSGRGVGMDVVRRNIESLRGTVELESVAGKSTCCRIRLPLTLAIIDGFLIGIGRSQLVVPLDMVVECLELSAADRQARDRHYVNLRGEVLPCIRLREMLGVEEDENVRHENVVVVRFGNHKAGLVVDRLLGELQTVIKPLGPLFRQLRIVSGSTILGSGEVALILDVPALVQHATRREQQVLSKGMPSMVAEARPALA
jgi:two-component system chemotaxis sensor kinase CheA